MRNLCKNRDFRQLSESICVYITVSNLGNTLSLFPNPASDKVDVAVGTTDSFTGTDSENAQTSYSVRVTNYYGVPVLSTRKTGNRFTLDTSSLDEGVYIVEINNGKNSYRKQLIVKH